ncbi:glucose PTS transporter subunit EIIB, partial [Aeromonas dhakensis]|uniref:glucose PTS transporter subunit EIIB n=2 Tax=Aeromonas dhakensis TaxID=196024 RepID=UPI003987AA79
GSLSRYSKSTVRRHRRVSHFEVEFAENKTKVAGLLIPATLTAMLVGITEPLEFTFLFISPLLFAIHALLAATMATVMYLFGVVGNMGGGLLDQFLPQNWIPMFHNHAGMMFTQIAIGLTFTGIWFLIFRTLILKFNLKTPGRDESEIRLYSKADYQAAKKQRGHDIAGHILVALGGAENINSLNNCATRLRISLRDAGLVAPDDAFKQLGAHGVVRHGDSIQIIVGLHVPQLRENMESLMNNPSSSSFVTES